MMEPPILTTLDARVDPRHSALLIIDMQKDFGAEGFGASQAGRDLIATRSIIPALERMLASAREAGVLIAHVGFWTLKNHLSDSGPWLAQRRRSTYSSDKLCMANSEGAEFIDELAPRPGEIETRQLPGACTTCATPKRKTALGTSPSSPAPVSRKSSICATICTRSTFR